MEDLIEHALTVKIDAATITTGSPEWRRNKIPISLAQRQMAWPSACFRIQLAAGIDSTASVMSLRIH